MADLSQEKVEVKFIGVQQADLRQRHFLSLEERRLPRHIDRESVICSASQSELRALSWASRFRPELLLLTARTRRIQHSLLAFAWPPEIA